MSKKKLIQLEKTNAKLTKELLQKERELKIESSLEKVRIMAMAMKQRDDMLTDMQGHFQSVEIIRCKRNPECANRDFLQREKYLCEL